MRNSRHNNALIPFGEARLIGWSRSMLYSGFNTLPRSVVRLADSGVRWNNADVMSLDETRIFSGFKMKTTLHFVAIAFSTLLTCASAIAQTGAPSLSTETEFQNNLTQNERYLICRTRVARDKKDRLVGTTEWILSLIHI